MSQRISDQHPLRQLFNELVRETFRAQLGVNEPGVPEYMANMLVDFTHRDRLFCLRNARGRQLEEVAEMLMEGDVSLNAASFEREREVRKHVGDYTLFFTGLFPEHLKRPRRSLSLDYFVDYVKAGKESYRIVSKFDQFEYRRVAPLFRRLAENFELCVYGLNRVRDRLRRMENADYRRVERTLIT